VHFAAEYAEVYRVAFPADNPRPSSPKEILAR
jgi:hypothetical protein